MRKNHKRLGATPAATTLGDVLAALQQGAIDGAIAAGTGRPGQARGDQPAPADGEAVGL